MDLVDSVVDRVNKAHHVIFVWLKEPRCTPVWMSNILEKIRQQHQVARALQARLSDPYQAHRNRVFGKVSRQNISIYLFGSSSSARNLDSRRYSSLSLHFARSVIYPRTQVIGDFNVWTYIYTHIYFSSFLPSGRLASTDTFVHAHCQGYAYVMYLQFGRLLLPISLD